MAEDFMRKKYRFFVYTIILTAMLWCPFSEMNGSATMPWPVAMDRDHTFKLTWWKERMHCARRCNACIHTTPLSMEVFYSITSRGYQGNSMTLYSHTKYPKIWYTGNLEKHHQAQWPRHQSNTGGRIHYYIRNNWFSRIWFTGVIVMEYYGDVLWHMYTIILSKIWHYIATAWMYVALHDIALFKHISSSTKKCSTWNGYSRSESIRRGHQGNSATHTATPSIPPLRERAGERIGGIQRRQCKST